MICPREENKRYFSWTDQRYKNDLTVRFNGTVLFEHINDCEENLPMLLEQPITWQLDHNRIEFRYDITVYDTVKESAFVTLDFDGEHGTLNVFRPALVAGAENIKFTALFSMNHQQLLLGDEYHQDDEKSIVMDFAVDTTQSFVARWTCSKVSRHGGTVYSDDLIMELK